VKTLFSQAVILSTLWALIVTIAVILTGVFRLDDTPYNHRVLCEMDSEARHDWTAIREGEASGLSRLLSSVAHTQFRRRTVIGFSFIWLTTLVASIVAGALARVKADSLATKRAKRVHSILRVLSVSAITALVLVGMMLWGEATHYSTVVQLEALCELEPAARDAWLAENSYRTEGLEYARDQLSENASGLLSTHLFLWILALVPCAGMEILAKRGRLTSAFT